MKLLMISYTFKCVFVKNEAAISHMLFLICIADWLC